MEPAFDHGLPYAVAALAVAGGMRLCSEPVDGAILVLGFCVPAVLAARLLQVAYLRWWRGGVAPDSAGRTRRILRAPLVIGGCVVITLLLVLVKRHPDGEPGLQERLRFLLALLTQAAATAMPLAVAFELSGSPRPELEDSLSRDHTSYSEGAAWIFFLGYLEIIFGDDSPRFPERMDDYLAANEIVGEDRENTCWEKMFIFIPMKRVAISSDKHLGANDTNIKREKRLKEAATEGGRKFGETHVYKVRRGDYCYRVSMEEATPLRTAALAVEDADADFDEADFEGFASRFLATLKRILESKPAIGSQVELVPIERADQLGQMVVQRVVEIQGQREGQGEAQGLERGGIQGQELERGPGQEQQRWEQEHESIHSSREPEEGSELD